MSERTSTWWCLSLWDLAARGPPRARQLPAAEDATWATTGTWWEPVPGIEEKATGSFMGAAGICLLPPGASQQPRAKGGVKIISQRSSWDGHLQLTPAQGKRSLLSVSTSGAEVWLSQARLCPSLKSSKVEKS